MSPDTLDAIVDAVLAADTDAERAERHRAAAERSAALDDIVASLRGGAFRAA